ncbi:MAG: DUF262 domain-containing protein [Myxococcota bacterium]
MHPDGEFDLEGLSTALAALSLGGVPETFPDAPLPFEGVDWSSHDWLTRVCEVQHWLCLDQELHAGAPPRDLALTLFQGLDMPEPADAFVDEGGQIRLTALGFAQLEARVALAQQHKERFEQDLADDFGPAQATRRWLAGWEDASLAVDLDSVQVHAKVTTWTIKWFKDLAEAQPSRLELNPSYQRDQVWSTSDSQKLIDSVLRGIPLPSIILNQRKSSRIHEIVDGKQRLTALLRFIGCHPDGVRYARERSTEAAPFELFQRDYPAWKRALGIRSPEEREHGLPFRLSPYPKGPLAPLAGKYYCEIREARVTIQGSEEAVEDVFEGPSDYRIPIILYQNTDLEQIHKVFGLYNKQGKQLNAEELRNAIYHHLDLTRLLLALAGDSQRPEALVPFVEGTSWTVVPELLAYLDVSKARFHRTKLVSWVAAVLTHAPRSDAKGVRTPSTSRFINSMLEAVTSNARHALQDAANLRNLAAALTGGAALLRRLAGETVLGFAGETVREANGRSPREAERRRGQGGRVETALRFTGDGAIDPSFANRKGSSGRWEDLPVVAAWSACALAVLGGHEPSTAEAVALRTVTEGLRPIARHQGRTQWSYLARTILQWLDALAVDLDRLDRSLKQQLGASCLPTLRAVAAQAQESA